MQNISSVLEFYKAMSPDARREALKYLHVLSQMSPATPRLVLVTLQKT